MAELRSIHEERLRDRAAREERLRRAGTAAEWARNGASALALAVLAVASFTGASPAWLVPPILLFGGSLAARAILELWRERAGRAAAFHREGLARLDGEWTPAPVTGEELAPPDHPYARDLDVVGERSLFTHLCRARTSPGAAALARWLLAPAPPAELRARQEAVRELRDRLDLREALALAGAPGIARVDADALATWGEGRPTLPWRALRVPLALASAAVPIGAVCLARGLGPAPLLAALAVAGAVHLALRRRVGAVLARVLDPAAGLSAVAEAMRLVEGETFTAPLLVELQAALRADGPASTAVGRLGGLVARLLALRNEVLGAIGHALLWPALGALAVERWRARHGPRLGAWIEALATFEALSSLASHAAEHPEDPFPELVEGGPVLDAAGVGHPLLPAARCVRNDVRLDAGGPALLLLSGSNMSGKSTLLRAVGANAVLALAGAPVRARSLTLSPLAIGASIRVHDSVLDGESRFYAELLRLRTVVGLTDGPRPVLFLLDEILHGTNSHDRLLGAEGVLGGLVERGAIGICSTHDLALTRVADGLAGRAVNAHLGDRLVDGRLAFDYALRPGVVARSNALELMRAVGLAVRPRDAVTS